MNDVLARTEYPHHSKLSTRTYLTPRFAQVYHLVRCPMQQISAFTTHLNASYDFVRKHMLQQIKPQQQQQQQQPSYKRTHRDRGRKTIHSSTVNNVDKSNRRLGRMLDHSNTSFFEDEDSVWMYRNHARFFRDRKLLVRYRLTTCPAMSFSPYNIQLWLFLVPIYALISDFLSSSYHTSSLYVSSLSFSRLKVQGKTVLVAPDVGFTLPRCLGYFGTATYNDMLMTHIVLKKIFLSCSRL